MKEMTDFLVKYKCPKFTQELTEKADQKPHGKWRELLYMPPPTQMHKDH